MESVKDIEKAKKILINLYLTIKIRKAEEVNHIFKFIFIFLFIILSLFFVILLG